MNGGSDLVRRSLLFLGRAIVVGLVFAVARGVAAAISQTEGSGSTTFPLEMAAGALVGLWLGFVATRVAGGSVYRATALGTLVFVNLLAVMIEGAAFAPVTQPLSTLPTSVALQLIVASVVGLATMLLVPRPRASEVRRVPPERSALSWLGRYLACAVVYVVLYFVVGALNFILVTGPYYSSGIAGLVVPHPAIVLSVAAVEGALFPVAVLPMLYALPGSRRQHALIAGMSLFVLGGVVPLIVAPSLPLILRVSSCVEILFQKFPAGMAAAHWLGPKD